MTSGTGPRAEDDALAAELDAMAAEDDAMAAEDGAITAELDAMRTRHGDDVTTWPDHEEVPLPDDADVPSRRGTRLTVRLDAGLSDALLAAARDERGSVPDVAADLIAEALAARATRDARRAARNSHAA